MCNLNMMMKDIEADHIVSQDFNLGLPEILDVLIISDFKNNLFDAYKDFWKKYRQITLPKGYLCWRVPVSVYLHILNTNPQAYRIHCRFNILPIKPKPINIEDFFNINWLQDALLTETPYGGYHGR